jgi:hypothetical protein
MLRLTGQKAPLKKATHFASPLNGIQRQTLLFNKVFFIASVKIIVTNGGIKYIASIYLTQSNVNREILPAGGFLFLLMPTKQSPSLGRFKMVQ